jgi:ABC-2 type transport system permease protein
MTAQTYDSQAKRNPLWDEIRALIRYKPLLGELISRNIKTRYKRSVLGVAWTMINPMLTMLVLTIVFSQLFAFSVPEYPVYLLSGLLLWNFFAQTSVAAIKDLIWSGGLLKRIFIPRALFAVAAIGTGIVNLLLSLVPLGIIILLTDSPLSWSMLFLPVSILLAGMFSLGIGLGLSTLAVYFTDVLDMYQIILLAWMYLTPIFYPLEILAPEFQWLIKVNPMYYILECFRMPIQLGIIPDTQTLVGASLSAALALLVGSSIFVRKSNEFPYYI